MTSEYKQQHRHVIMGGTEKMWPVSEYDLRVSQYGSISVWAVDRTSGDTTPIGD